jgi:glycosyltransferase involved in cell wall biosynthesis
MTAESDELGSDVASPTRVAIVAARNEADRVARTVAALRAAAPGIVVTVADDGSEDGTRDAALAAGATVIGRNRPHGKGGNMTAAAEAALDGLDPSATVLLCDGDLGHSAERLAPLLEAVEAGEADLAIAAFSTRVGGGLGLAKGYAARAIERRSGFRVSEPISGQRAMRAATLARLIPFAPGYGMETGMTIDAVRLGSRVVEVELDLAHRATGRDWHGFVHRGRQLRDIVRAERARRGDKVGPA